MAQQELWGTRTEEVIQPIRARTGTDPICYVCGGSLHGEYVTLPADAKHGVLHRHRVVCAPGAARYMQNRKLRRAFLREFKKGETPNGNQND